MKKKIVLGLSILGVLLFFLGMWAWQESRIMDVPMLSAKAVENLKKSRLPFDGDDMAELRIDGVTVPYERAEERYYISRNMEEDHWKGTLEAFVGDMQASAAWVEDEAFGDIRSAIAEGHVFQCLIYSESGYQVVSVLFTGLPVMNIDGNMGETGARVTVFDPILSMNGGYQVEETLAYYNIRGNASKRFEKIGYRLEFFCDDGSAGRDLSLLGMRSDNDWQLKALYSDRSKLRDKLSTELWNRIAEQSGTQADTGCRMEFLELIINGEYRGLYGLVEPTDYKSLGLDKSRDIIYKAASDEWPDEDSFDASEAEQSFSCAGINIRKGGKDYYPGIWEPFRTFWNSGYEMGSEEDLKTLYGCIDRQNFIEYDLYYNAIAGMDNRFKNIIYSTVQNADGTYTIRRIPWDQNYSWGDDFEQGEDKDIKNIRYNPDLAKRWLNEEVFRRMQDFDDTLPEDMLAVWKKWRGSFLKEEYWKTYAREQMEYLTGSGAFGRDTEKWPESENKEGTEEIEAFIDARFVWLDNYLEELSQQ